MRKFIRVSGYVLLFFILVFVISAITLNVYFNKKIVENAKEQISKATHNEYALSLDGLSINLFNNTITIKNLTIAPSKIETHSKAQYVFKAKVLRIIGFSILSYLKKHDLLIDRVEFEEPQIAIFQGYERLPKKNKDSPEKNFSLYTAFSKTLNSVSIGYIDIMNSRFNIYKNGTDSSSVFSTNNNSISIKNFTVNSETDKKNRLFFAEKFEVVMNTFSYNFGSGLYTLFGKRLYASYVDSTLIVDSLKLVPNFSKKEFADAAGHQISRVKIISSKVSFQKMDVKLFFEYNWLVIHKVDIAGCFIDVYRDNSLPLKHIVRPCIQAILKGLPFFVAVDSIEMKNGEAVYEDLNPDLISTGKISINKISAIITGVQNDTSSYSKKSSIKAKFDGYFMNKGKFIETFTFPLNTTNEFFYCSGSLTNMPMTAFNPMIQRTKHISIKSGQLDKASFSFVANENSSNGKMKFMYHDLKIEPMNKSEEKVGLIAKLKKFLLNKLIIKDSNPGKNGLVRVSKIHAEHNPYRFFPYYSIQSILSGIAPAIEGKKMVRRIQKKHN